jgi:beta-galactosidase
VLDEHLGKEKRPHVDPFYEAQTVTDVKLTEMARYEDNLDVLVTKRVKSHKVICMEDMGQDYGFIRYTSHMEYTDDRQRELYIEGLADRATVYIDGKYIGTVMRQAEDNKPIFFTVAKGGSDLTILVENCGRINYGYNMYDYKGINGCVRLRIYNEDGSHLYNLANNMHFTIECIPLKSTEGLKYTKDISRINTPAFYKGTFDAKAGVDTFVDMNGYKKGLVFVNGFNLGKYWEIGAQRTLYLPGDIVKDKNVIEIFELHTPKKELTVSMLDHSLLCEPVAGTLASADFELL